jgi:hypothetical protein
MLKAAAIPLEDIYPSTTFTANSGGVSYAPAKAGTMNFNAATISR